MPDNDFRTDLPLAGDLVAEDFDGWPDWLKTEFDERAHDGHVGSRLLSQNARVRVWEIRLAPGQRWHAHRHVLDYFWTAVTPCCGRQHLMDGTAVEYAYSPGHETCGPGEFKVHDLENIGDGDMVFMTVEFLDSANKPLTIPEDVRRVAA